MTFRLYHLRFAFAARDAIHFPPGKASNLLRGAFGSIFRTIACVPQCTAARECELAPSCPYARMFEPAARGAGPSGLADHPRPFVFRATHLDGRTVRPGEPFHFDLNLFDMKSPAASYLVLAFSQLAREGLGPGRGRAELRNVRELTAAQQPIELSLAPSGVPVDRVRVSFVTPTELKGGQGLLTQPDFGVLAARIRDRVSTLRELYGAGPLPIDFRGFGERASAIRMARCSIQQVDIARRSGRTGQVHSIGGFIGEAEYEGELGEFLPFLHAAKWTGVGRQTVWGKGELAVYPGSP